MGVSLQICQGCIQLLAPTESERRMLEQRLEILRRNLEEKHGPVRVERIDCLLKCGEGCVCLVLKKDGQLRRHFAHLDPASPVDPHWNVR